jgi:NAD(P)-dependent dehydrogenase (short-subunit alcohol dehydrogenase family)/3-oxoacyl-(acyl-carrier-protein) synthase
MFPLSGKLALVTGGAKNVGKAIAKALADRGAHVLVNYFHSHDEAKQTLVELTAAGATADLIRASIARPDQVERMFAEIEQRFGRLDILVNNAADGALLPLADITDEHLDRALDTNYKGGLRCARAAAPLMARNGGGSIVTVSALGGSQMVMANYLACAPAKAAAEAMTRYLAVEFAPLNVRVNTASAAMLVSEVADAFPHAEQMQATIAAATPLGRLGTAEEFADVVAFLAGDDSRWITGQVILADGGLTLGASLLSPPKPSAPKPPAPKPAPARVSVREPDTEDSTDSDTVADDIAVVGMGLAVAGANSPDELWELRTTGRELFVPVPEDRWQRETFFSADPSDEDKSYQDTCVFITGFQPDADSLAGLRPSSDHELTTLWLRHSLAQALRGVRRVAEDDYAFLVGYTPDGSQHLEEAGVLAGINHRAREIAEEMAIPPAERQELLAGIDATLSKRYWRGAEAPSRFLPHRVGQLAMAGLLPDGTELQMVDTACSSSLYAVDIGIKGLLMGKHDVAVCGGAFALAPRGTVLFSKLQGLSKRGAVHSLDAGADGVIFADGAAVVVLKRLSRARRDGDRVLAVLKAFGASSDGKGKAIYAPNSAGQDLAVQQALATGVRGQDVDWIIAHATGTPAGDLAEFTTLKRHFGTDRVGYVTSNKSLIGHTGWAAGVVSVIEAILGLEHELIPGQFRFSAPPADFEMDTTNLVIPSEPVPWPRRDDRARTVAVSGFGFGGTNAHLIVRESPAAGGEGPAAGAKVPSTEDRLAIVGWAAHVPGLSSRDEVVRWVTGAGPAPEPSFGEFYPAPPFKKMRLPPATVRTIDRCQLMIVECAHGLRAQLPDFWQESAEKAGVFVGNMGPTRAAMLYANRCYLDDVERALREGVPGSPRWRDDLVSRLRERVRAQVPPSNEDSFPGQMPNIISARVANYFDLKGPNITVDSGLASTLTAIETAGRYLRTGEIDFALAGGINGNSLPEYSAILADLVDLSGVGGAAEGAFLFALATERTAKQAGLPVLAFVDDLGVAGTQASGEPEVACGDTAPDRARYLGGGGGVALLTALHGPAGRTRIRCTGARVGQPAWLTLTVTDREDTPAAGPDGGTTTAPADRTGGDHAAEPAPLPAAAHTVALAARPAVEPVAVSAPGRVAEPAVVPAPLPVADHLTAPVAAPVAASAAEPGAESAGRPRVRRHVPELRKVAATQVRERTPFLPPGVVVLTDLPDLPGLPPDALVLSTARSDVHRPCWQHLPRPTPEAMRDLLTGHRVQHLRVVTDLSRSAPLPDGHTCGGDSLIALHDATFLALQQGYHDLGAEGASFCTLLLGALPAGVPHPFTGLFTGLVKCAQLELTGCLTFALGVSTSNTRAAMMAAERESRNARSFPVVFDRQGTRMAYTLRDEPAEVGQAALGPHSTVLAFGGARGITAEVMKSVAERFRPRIYLVGSNPVDDYPAEVFAGDDESFAKGRQAFIRQGLAAGVGRTVAACNREFDRMIDARAARANIAAMREHCGADRVSYLPCDVTDADAVSTVVDRVLAAGGRVDLLVNAPGRNRSALIKDKDFAEFTAIRDLKLRGYRNLKRAFRGRPPRVWCNFGSLLGYFGQVGEPDYASGNDFLATAAMHANQARGEDEFTIGWTLWEGVGMGANELTNAYYKRAGSYSHMAVAEGAHHFAEELHTIPRRASVVHLGTAERSTVDSFYPGYLPARDAGFYLRELVAEDGDSVTFECPFRLDTDAYLTYHLVRDAPTLPGTFVTELAAEAARYLVPDKEVVAFTDVTFAHFLKVRAGDRPDVKRITARIVPSAAELTTVEVRITTDVVSPGGVLLAKDRLHFSARVLLREEFPPPPRWDGWPSVDEVAVTDPYHVPASPVRLTGPFVSTSDTRVGPMGKRARYRVELAGQDPVWSRFTMPSILLDGLARTGVLNLVDGGLIPVAAPLSVRRVDLYQRANDIDLVRRHGSLELYATPAEFTMAGDTPDNRFVAATADGTVVAQMKDIKATLIGYVDAASGEFHPPDEPVADRRTAVLAGQR